VKALNVEACSR